MLERCTNNLERWGGVHRLIDQWLEHRKELISLYVNLEKQVPKSYRPISLESKLVDFCNELVDYASQGHFEIYEQLLREAQAFNDGSEAILGELMPEIQQSTDQLLSFQDQYAGNPLTEELKQKLHHDLSILGESLAERFDHEDRLIADIHEAHRASLPSL